MSYDSPTAIPVKVRQRTLRQLCIQVDEDFMRESENPEEYKFTGRTFRGRYKQRGAYTDE
jgi:hypothetical protein